MLRLVHPAREGQPPRPPRTRSVALSLTAEEARHFRTALRNTARAYGTYACLAEVLGVSLATLEAARGTRHRPSGTLVIRLAQSAGMSVEAILTGQLSAAGRCSACGSRVGDRPVRVGGAS